MLNCLCYLGGFPGDGLSDLYGVVAEEIDTLYPSDRNRLVLSEGKGEIEIYDYAELLKVKDAGIKYRKLPHGLEYHRRQSDKNVFDFYLNTSEDDIRIDVPHCEDVISGDDISGEISIPPKGFVCLKSTILRCF